MKGWLCVLLLMLLSFSAEAVQPKEMLADPALETRARHISADLRCLVCQNQSIDDSDADLAHDLRLLVRQRLQAGDSDAAVRQYLVDRYGDYILLNPPLKPATLFLWLGPLLMLVAGGGLVWLFYLHRLTKAERAIPDLSELEKERLATLLTAPPDDAVLRKTQP